MESKMPLTAEALVEFESTLDVAAELRRSVEEMVNAFEQRTAVQRTRLEIAQGRKAEVESGAVAMQPGDEALARVRARIA